MSQQLLVVEGRCDADFYDAFCRECGHKDILVTQPSVCGGGGDGKGNAISLLPLLVLQMHDGSVDRLAAVIDADFASEGTGFVQVRDQVEQIFQDEGFSPAAGLPAGISGRVFTHPGSNLRAGYWIMPNNAQDGMLEDFVLGAVTNAAQTSLLARARKAVGQIPQPLFKAIHRSKADAATWMAWQKIPGQPVVGAIGGKLVDMNHTSIIAFRSWLQQIFN